MIRGWNPTTLVVVLLVAVFFGAMGLMVRRRLLDWRAARVDPLNMPRPPRESTWGRVIFIISVAYGANILLRAPAESPPGDPPVPSPSAAVALSSLAPLLVVVGLIALRIARRMRQPYVRAALQTLRGDHDGAVATARAEMERQAAGLATPGATARVDDPWAPPAAADDPARRRALADGWHTLSAIEGERKDWPLALRYAEQALLVDPTNATIYRGSRGNALVEVGRAEEGLPLLRATLAELPGSAVWYRSTFLMGVAKGLIATGHAAEAGPVLDHARRLGWGALIFPLWLKRRWRTEIDELQTQAAAARTPAPGSG